MRKKLVMLIAVLSLVTAFENISIANAYTLDTIKVGSNPKDVAVDPKTNMVYVASFEDVIVIDGTNNNIVAEIPIGDGANVWAIEVNSSTRRAYVAANQLDSVVVIDVAQNKVIATISVGNDPEGIAINPETNRIYVANAHNSDSPNSISVIDGSSNMVIGSIDTRSTSYGGLGANWPSAMAVDVERNTLYVGGIGSTSIMVVDGSSSKIIDQVERYGNFRRMAIDQNIDRVYAANIDYGTVDVIERPERPGDGDKYVLIDSIQKSSEQPIVNPGAIDVNPKTNRIYVADGDSSISVIDGESRQIVSRIDVARIPIGIAVNPETNMIYVANFDSNSISVINGSTNGVVLSLSSFTFEIIGATVIIGIIGIVALTKKVRRREMF